MSISDVRSYNALIGHVIAQSVELASQAQVDTKMGVKKPIAGFCPLHGPTGGGKSSSLYRKGYFDGVVPALETIRNEGFQAILVTHRWNILHDLYESVISRKDSKGRPFSVSVIYGKEENCIASVNAKPLPHENPADSFPDLETEMTSLKTQGFLVDDAYFGDLQRLVRSIKRLSQRVDRNDGRAYGMQGDPDKLKQDLLVACSSLEKKVIQLIQKWEEHVKAVEKQFGIDSETASVYRKKLYRLRSKLWIRRLLPGIAYEDDGQHLLIMTTHKLFHSFYDGKQIARLNSSRLAGRIIFIDEFDYQADVLQGLLAENQVLQAPPEFLGRLIEEGKRYLRRSSGNSDIEKKVAALLSKIITDLEQDLENHSIDLIDNRALIMPEVDGVCDDALFDKSYLFRSDHLITKEPLLMRQVEGGFEVRKSRRLDQNKADNNDTGTVYLDDFLRTMEKHIRLFVLAVISSKEFDSQNTLLQTLCHILFDSANDYRDSYYKEAIIKLIPSLIVQTRHAELKHLIESNLLANTKSNMFGLTCWLLEKNRGASIIDSSRLDIRRAALVTTPEGLLLSLSSRNLVFGLSATAYIERSIGNFDLRWVEGALRYLAEVRNPTVKKSYLGNTFIDRSKDWFKQPLPYVQTRVDRVAQQQMIASLNKEKQKIRNSNLITEISDFIEFGESEAGKTVMNLLPLGFFDNEKTEEKSTSEGVVKYRKELLLKLLQVISLAGQSSSEHQGHLVFVNSIRYLRDWLIDDQTKDSRESVAWLQVDLGFKQSIAQESPLWDKYEIFIPVEIHGNKALLCVLTASNQKTPGFYQAYQAAFNTGRKVIVLTQTATATNGINLDFSLPITGQPKDLTCLYLVESHHYYFSPPERSNKQKYNDLEMNAAGNQLRYLEKLVRCGEFSHEEQRKFIMPVMARERNGISNLNKRYKQGLDYIKNTAANVQQQVGRIERTWVDVPEIRIYVERKVAKTLVEFASLPAYTNFRAQVSFLNQQLLSDLVQVAETEQVDIFVRMLVPQQDGQQAIEIIDNHIVPAIRKLRALPLPVNGLEQKGNKSILALWKALGNAVLKLDYAWQFGKNNLGMNQNLRLLDWACIEKPAAQKEWWYDPGSWQFFSAPDEGLKLYAPDRLYRPVRGHCDIINWFNQRGYRIALWPPSNELQERYVLHPLVTQRLLQGRLGEEAIRGLLKGKSIDTTDYLQDVRALELYDFAIRGTRFRVDAKYWHSATLDMAEQRFRDWVLEDSETTEDPLGLGKRLQEIRAIEGYDSKLVIINLTSSTERVALKGFDSRMQRMPDSANHRADILVLGGCLVDEEWKYTDGFEHLCEMLVEIPKGSGEVQ